MACDLSLARFIARVTRLLTSTLRQIDVYLSLSGLTLHPISVCSYIAEAMVAHTVLLDFTVSSSVIADMEKRSGLKSAIANVLAEHFTGLKPLTESNIDGSLLVLYTGPRGSLITVRGYTEGLITLNIEYYKQDDQEALLTFEVCMHELDK